MAINDIRKPYSIAVAPFLESINRFSSGLVQFLSIMRFHFRENLSKAPNLPLNNFVMVNLDASHQSEPFGHQGRQESMSDEATTIVSRRVCSGHLHGRCRGRDRLSFGPSHMMILRGFPSISRRTLQILT